MKKFVFVSDFDGTLTHKDFYHVVLEKYWPERGQDFYQQWKKSNKIDLNFLNTVFNALERREEDLLLDIYDIPFDEQAIGFIKQVQGRGGDFVILSAGTSYYIDRFLEHKKIVGVKVIANPGFYRQGGLFLQPAKDSPYYSDVYGLDKMKVVLDLQKRYGRLYYAGDSEPDVEACTRADVAFAKGELQTILRERGISFVPFSHFGEVARYMEQKEWSDR